MIICTLNCPRSQLGNHVLVKQWCYVTHLSEPTPLHFGSAVALEWSSRAALMVNQPRGGQGMSDCRKTFPVQEWSHLIGLIKPHKDPPGHSCHLGFDPREPPRLCISLTWGNATLLIMKYGGSRGQTKASGLLRIKPKSVPPHPDLHHLQALGQDLDSIVGDPRIKLYNWVFISI